MKTLYVYRIRFTRNGGTEPEIKPFDALNPGSAFAKCAKKYPGCRLLEVWLEGRLITGGGVVCRLSYAPPSTVRIAVEPKFKKEQLTFGFLKEISRDRNATASIPPSYPSHIAAETAREKARIQKHKRRISGTFPAVELHQPEI
jgi:hypothetical protein